MASHCKCRSGSVLTASALRRPHKHEEITAALRASTDSPYWMRRIPQNQGKDSSSQKMVSRSAGGIKQPVERPFNESPRLGVRRDVRRSQLAAPTPKKSGGFTMPESER